MAKSVFFPTNLSNLSGVPVRFFRTFWVFRSVAGGFFHVFSTFKVTKEECFLGAVGVEGRRQNEGPNP